MSSFSSKRPFAWTQWTEVEKSYALGNAYRKNFINSKDVEDFLKAARLSNISSWGAPIALFLFLDKIAFGMIKKSRGFAIPIPTFNLYKYFLTGAFTLVWLNYNPFYLKSLEEKEKLLKVTYKHVGNKNILLCNDQLPRWMTEQEANRLLRKLYNERNSVWTGILYNREVLGGFKPDSASFQNVPLNKIAK